MSRYAPVNLRGTSVKYGGKTYCCNTGGAVHCLCAAMRSDQMKYFFRDALQKCMHCSNLMVKTRPNHKNYLNFIKKLFKKAVLRNMHAQCFCNFTGSKCKRPS